MQTSNFLQNNEFQLVIPSFETTRFLATTFEIPSITLPSVGADTPFSKLKFAGDKATFSPLTFEFIIDENMQNYTELYKWLIDISYTDSFDSFNRYPQKSSHQPLGEQDIKIIVLDSKDNPTNTFTFLNAIPISLSGTGFSSTTPDITYLRATITFDYDYFTIEKS